MAERDFNDPSVQRIVKYSKKILGAEGNDLNLIHVGETTIIANTYHGEMSDLIDDPRTLLPRNIEILLGVVTPDGEPFVSLVPLRAALCSCRC